MARDGCQVKERIIIFKMRIAKCDFPVNMITQLNQWGLLISLEEFVETKNPFIASLLEARVVWFGAHPWGYTPCCYPIVEEIYGLEIKKN